MAKQTRADRERRLVHGGCPVHGIGMVLAGDFYYVVESGPPLGVPMTQGEILASMKMRIAYTIVECPRQDCGIRAKLLGVERDSPCELLPESAYLLDEAPTTARR